MTRKFFMAFLCVMLGVSSACAESYLWSDHSSIAGLTSGRSDYSAARFLGLWFDIENDTEATEQYTSLTGSLTLGGGNYSYWDGTEMKTVSGTSQTFDLVPQPGLSVGDDYVEYWLRTENSEQITFLKEAESSLAGVSASWTFPDMPSMNNQTVIPSFRTTQQQLASFVPYVEPVLDGENVTAIRWRIVNPSDVTVPVSQDFDMGFRLSGLFDRDHNNRADPEGGRSEQYIPAGTTPEDTIELPEPVALSDIWAYRIRFYTYEDGNEHVYDWWFVDESKRSSYLWSNHCTEAQLVDGKTDIRSAQFFGLFLSARTSDVVVESAHLEAQAQMTIPGGGYTLKDDSVAFSDVIDTIPEGTDQAFTLRAYDGTYPGDDFLECQPIDDEGRNLTFSGGAETGFNGKTITWTFPAELGLTGSAVVPDFKSLTEQKLFGAPYAELVSSDGYITAVNYRIANQYDTSTPIRPEYRTDFSINVYRNSGGTINSGWRTNSSSGTYALPEPLPVNNFRRLRVRFRTYENSSNPCVYQWTMRPATQEQRPSGDGGSGSSGCDLGMSGVFALGLVLLGKSILKKHP